MAEWYDNRNMGSAFPLMDYGANQLASYANNALPNTQNNSGLEWWMNADRGRYPSPMMPGMLDQTGQMGASNYRAPEITQPRVPEWISDPNRPAMPQDEGWVDKTWTGIKNTGKKFTTPMLAMMKLIAGERSPEKQAAYDAITGGKSIKPWQTGTYKGNQYGLYNSPSGLKVSSDVLGWGEGYEKNFDSRFGSKSLQEMEQKKIDWAMNRLQNKKAISQRLRDVLTARGLIGGDQRPDRTITDTVTDRVTDVVQPGKGGEPSRPAYTGPKTFSYDPGLARAMGGQRATKSGGFTDPGRGSYGPHSRAEGGRIGYQEGELVEDEYMAEATPGGMMEENIEEVQGEPTREQLEAIALEIFRLPLEELNEEQLNVVYQAAMEQEPSEEEVQFAAQEGPGEGIASLV